MEKKLITPNVLADLLGLAEKTIYNHYSNGGNLPLAIKQGTAAPLSLY